MSKRARALLLGTVATMALVTGGGCGGMEVRSSGAGAGYDGGATEGYREESNKIVHEAAQDIIDGYMKQFPELKQQTYKEQILRLKGNYVSRLKIVAAQVEQSAQSRCGNLTDTDFVITTKGKTRCLTPYLKSVEERVEQEKIRIRNEFSLQRFLADPSGKQRNARKLK